MQVLLPDSFLSKKEQSIGCDQNLVVYGLINVLFGNVKYCRRIPRTLDLMMMIKEVTERSDFVAPSANKMMPQKKRKLQRRTPMSAC